MVDENKYENLKEKVVEWPSVRPPAVAGAFYPEDRKKLSEALEKLCKNCSKREAPKGSLRCIIVPHAGYAYCGEVAAAGYCLLNQMKPQPKKILLLGPSHYALFTGIAETGTTAWKTPLGEVLTGKPSGLCGVWGLFEVLEEAHAEEHCLEVEIPFIQRAMVDGYMLYPMLTGDVSPEQVASALSKPLKNKDTVLIISSDLSHYHSYEEARVIDARANEAIPALDSKKAVDIEACGKIGILAAISLAKRFGWKAYFMDYKNSGDTEGDKAQVVGYGCYAFYEE